MITINIRRKTEAGWVGVPLSESGHFSVEQFLQEYDGQQVVMECKHEDRVLGYVCGTKTLQESYLAKGFKAYTFSEFINKGHAWAQKDVDLSVVQQVFPGVEIEQIGLFN